MTVSSGRRLRGLALATLTLAWFASAGRASAQAEGAAVPADVYARACAHCHGVDGRGVDASRLALPVPLPDFTDCQFAPREPDADWLAVAHDGGPARGFDQTMPAFGDALSGEEAEAAVAHVRTFCPSRDWPRGELNLPKALVTEKAFPEDELIWLTTFSVEGTGSFSHKVIYEKRFGPRNQVEFVLPVVAADGPGGWRGGVGDIAVGFKRVLAHSHARGSIVSATTEVKLPTGDSALGFGNGFAVFEPFVTVGQVLPGDGFLQFQGGVELPLEGGHARDGFWRTVVGRSFTQGRFGRSWSPMVEVLGAREFESGARTHWDLLPQVQVSLNTRQHVLFNVGVRVPLTDSGPRATQVLTYILWDWFDGGLFAGW
jgi:mono/diheme cytochrome c family protein